uniref:RxLR effector candidate protein n=1 Tax=Hyaloperonospora arabidopsidis (strain Emoy2) TaxID=559515 RepID=M4BDJ8_HYAAE
MSVSLTWLKLRAPNLFLRSSRKKMCSRARDGRWHKHLEPRTPHERHLRSQLNLKRSNQALILMDHDEKTTRASILLGVKKPRPALRGMLWSFDAEFGSYSTCFLRARLGDELKKKRARLATLKCRAALEAALRLAAVSITAGGTPALSQSSDNSDRPFCPKL